jgi:signal transduction histidine kinase
VRRLRWLMLIFFVGLTVPLAYLVFRTNQSLEQEEVAELRFFASTLFDTMEQELAALVIQEEARAIDDYNYHRASTGGEFTGTERSPLSVPPQADYILGYLQNNPDGSFQTPLLEPGREAPPALTPVLGQLQEVNRVFNSKRTALPDPRAKDLVGMKSENESQRDRLPSFAQRYLDESQVSKQRAFLGQEEKRVQPVTPSQALNLARRDVGKVGKESPVRGRPETNAPGASVSSGVGSTESRVEEGASELKAAGAAPVPPVTHAKGYQAEVDPLQSVHIDEGRVLLFRRIVIDNQVFRQGVVIRTREFLSHLARTHFDGQPMSRFTNLTLRALEQGREWARFQSGATVTAARFAMERSFPRPFSFVRATLASEQIPRSTGRSTLILVVTALTAVVLMGLFAIYQSARVVLDISERRSGFVSSVTHELKTPLTNIRMYIEMLEQGIAADPERELEYYRILGTESARLSRLIDNVLEFSKLEKKQRNLDLRDGTLEEVIREAQDVMAERLRQEGFVLKVENETDRPFPYDREVMVQVLVNLIENSLKFGKTAPLREITLRVRHEGRRARISVSDTGPGIPRHALKRVFDDFYRVEGPLTRTTKGTGIGLALVKRFVEAMGGSVSAANNRGAGCTITIDLPS